MSVQLLLGDCRAILPTLLENSVHCVVTSPPYWGLRDYGTASWDGGDSACDHAPERRGGRFATPVSAKQARNTGSGTMSGRDCPCGATRIDAQLGLEPTPEEYLARMVGVFREVRRVLRDDGTCWLNMGDGYASGEVGRHDNGSTYCDSYDRKDFGPRQQRPRVAGLKPKDLVGMPWRLAFALQADGWFLRADCIWAKPNPMPESVTDRPTKAHEYVFLLTKAARYFYDADAVREPDAGNDHARSILTGQASLEPSNGLRSPHRGLRTLAGRNGTGRNLRTVWTIATEPTPDAHFATFPQALAARCIQAGSSERGCCAACGAPWERMGEKELINVWHRNKSPTKAAFDVDAQRQGDQASRRARDGHVSGYAVRFTTLGWQPTCAHEAAPVPCTVLDPFAGTGTVGQVAERCGRDSVLIELNPVYVGLARERTAQRGLFATPECVA